MHILDLLPAVCLIIQRNIAPTPPVMDPERCESCARINKLMGMSYLEIRRSCGLGLAWSLQYSSRYSSGFKAFGSSCSGAASILSATYVSIFLARSIRFALSLALLLNVSGQKLKVSHVQKNTYPSGLAMLGSRSWYGCSTKETLTVSFRGI